MSDSINLYNNASALDTAPAFEPFTGVKIWADDEKYFFSGNETGRVLEAEFPWATQAIADNVLASISGFVYQPFTAQNALLDPAAELGDSVSVGGVSSVLASIDTNFNAMCASNISAPSDEEIDHEYHYVKPEERTAKRVSSMTAELRVMSDKIEGIVVDVDENSSRITQTATELTARVESAEGMATEAQQTAEGFSQRITDAEGNIAELNSSIDGISQRVTTAEGNATEALQTANGFSQRITSAEGDISSIEHTLEGVAFTSSLADGTTVINGGCITTGTLSANKLYVNGQSIGGAGSSLEAIYAKNGTITALTSQGLTLGVNSVQGTAVLLTADGVTVDGTVVPWSAIVAGGTGGTAVFG